MYSLVREKRSDFVPHTVIHNGLHDEYQKPYQLLNKEEPLDLTITKSECGESVCRLGYQDEPLDLTKYRCVENPVNVFSPSAVLGDETNQNVSTNTEKVDSDEPICRSLPERDTSDFCFPETTRYIELPILVQHQTNINIDDEDFEFIIPSDEDLLNYEVSYEESASLKRMFDGMIENNAGLKNPNVASAHQLSDAPIFEVTGQNSTLDNEILDEEDTPPKDCTSSTDLVEPNLGISSYSSIFNMFAKSNGGSCDNSNMYVQTSDRHPKEKKHCCLYCEKTYTKLARHLETVHKNEPDVKKFRDLPRGAKERRDILDTLRNLGMSKWNTNANLNKGQLLTSRRPNPKFHRSAKDFTTCPKCRASRSKKSFSRHVKDCLKPVMKGQRSIMVLGRAIEGRLHSKAIDRLRLVVFPVMREDAVVRLIRYDWLIITFGNLLCLKYVPHFQHDHIRAQLRLTGRLLMALKSICSDVTDFASVYQPQFYDNVLDAIRIVAKYDQTSNEFQVPRVATNCVTLLKQIGLLLKAEYIKKKEPENKLQTEDFMTLMDANISVMINKAAMDTQARMRREKIELIPSTDDIKRLAKYLDSERRLSFNQLTEKYSYSNWARLAELTMASIIVFNRRRTGETRNILVSDFLSRESIDQSDKPSFATLSDQSKQFVMAIKRIKIRGKRGRTVRALLKPGIDKSVEILIRHRKESNIAPDNPFLFALPSTVKQIKVIDACAVLRKFSSQCGADKPETLRGTSMRKHIASTCIGLELNDNLVSEVADFMGHHEKIHRDYYRHNTLNREIVKMSELLQLAQGNINNEGDDEDDGDDSDDELILPLRSDQLEESLGTDELAMPLDCIDQVEPSRFVHSVTESNKNIEKKRKKCEVPASTSEAAIEKESGEPFRKKKFSKVKWSDEEKGAVYKAFASYFKDETLPSFELILKEQDNHKCLKRRTPEQIKTWIHNQFRSVRARRLK